MNQTELKNVYLRWLNYGSSMQDRNCYKFYGWIIKDSYRWLNDTVSEVILMLGKLTIAEKSIISRIPHDTQAST